jgi:predicted transcriptional regulator
LNKQTASDDEKLAETLTREGLAAIDAGDVVEHAAVKIWADNLCIDGENGDAEPLQ